MITISGPFDPLQLCSKIRCMGGKVIKDIQIKPSPPPPPPTCRCNKDIEQLKMRMEDLLRVCVGNNNDIEQLKQQVDRLLEQDQQISSCADLKRAIQQLEIRMEKLHEMLSQKGPKCTGEPQGQNCGMVIIPSSDSCSYLKCHGYCGSPYCRCYASCRFSEEDTAAACSLM